MDWPVILLIAVLAVAVAIPVWRLQKRAPGRHAHAPDKIGQPAEPGSEGMNVPAAGEVAPGPDEPSH